MTGPKRIYFSNYRHSTSRAQHHGTILDQPDGRYHCQLIILLGVLDKSILINWVCNWALADWTRTVTLHMLNLSSAYGGWQFYFNYLGERNMASAQMLITPSESTNLGRPNYMLYSPRLLQHSRSWRLAAVLLDFSKAFEKVPHGWLMSKLLHYGVQGLRRIWIHHWLIGCEHRVVVDSIGSDPCSVTSGMPLDSVFGPRLHSHARRLEYPCKLEEHLVHGVQCR